MGNFHSLLFVFLVTAGLGAQGMFPLRVGDIGFFCRKTGMFLSEEGACCGSRVTSVEGMDTIDSKVYYRVRTCLYGDTCSNDRITRYRKEASGKVYALDQNPPERLMFDLQAAVNDTRWTAPTLPSRKTGGSVRSRGSIGTRTGKLTSFWRCGLCGISFFFKIRARSSFGRTSGARRVCIRAYERFARRFNTKHAIIQGIHTRPYGREGVFIRQPRQDSLLSR
jgi:hypothetical protein